jgi:protein tyrosine phosphatase (PTP) superfamily phosphohydrolase (DUF442 family)
LTLENAWGSLLARKTSPRRGGGRDTSLSVCATRQGVKRTRKQRPLGRPLGICILLLFAVGAYGSVANGGQASAAKRPAQWAVRLERPGLPNFYKVSRVLYRGAQPKREGIPQLQDMGIKTVVSLRVFHDDSYLLRGTSLNQEVIPFHTWHPEDQDVVRFLQIVIDLAKRPVFVHCQRGIDRTGTMVAIYRIAVQGWSREEAIREMTQGGFGYDGKFPNLVRYLQKVDIAAIKRKAGLRP